MDKWQFKGGRKGSNKHAVAGQSWVLERGYGNVEVTWAKENSSETVTHKLTAHRYRQVWTNKPIGKAQRDSVGDIAEGDNDTQVPGSPIIWHVLGDKRKAVGDSSDPFEPISPGNESSGARSNGSPGLANLAPSLSTIVADIAAAAQQSSSDRAALTSSRHGAGGVASLTAAVAAARKQTVGRGGGATSPYGSSKRPRLDDGDSASGRNPLPTSAARLPASSIDGSDHALATNKEGSPDHYADGHHTSRSHHVLPARGGGIRGWVQSKDEPEVAEMKACLLGGDCRGMQSLLERGLPFTTLDSRGYSVFMLAVSPVTRHCVYRAAL
jgi:hypothetical protein